MSSGRAGQVLLGTDRTLSHGELGAALSSQKPPEQTVHDISFGSAAISLLSRRMSSLY